MSSGVRYKWQGSHIKILTAFDADSPSHAISAVTKANPGVATSTAHGLPTTGVAVIYVTGVGGMTELNSRAIVVERVDANTFKLLNINTTNYGTYTSGGQFDVGSFSEMCELTGWNDAGQEAATIDATTICSDELEYESGLSGQGSVTANYNFAPLTNIQVAMHNWRISGLMTAFQIILPGAGGTITQLGFVVNESFQSANGQLWTGSSTFRLTGSRDVRATA